jgi:hypothetical protein
MSNPTPPRLLEFLTGLLLPRDYREQVLGDMQERYTSPLGYLADAASAVPAAIIGQIRRATSPAFVLLEALLVYASYLGAALCLHSIDGSPDFLQAAAITGVVMLGLLLRDAYYPRPSPSRRSLITSVYHAVYFSNGLVWAWHLVRPNHLFPSIMTSLLGLGISSVLICLLRIWIETQGQDRPRGAR